MWVLALAQKTKLNPFCNAALVDTAKDSNLVPENLFNVTRLPFLKTRFLVCFVRFQQEQCQPDRPLPAPAP